MLMNILQLTTTIKKEIWEYKKIFTWLPMIIALIIISAPILGYLLNDTSNMHWLDNWQRLADSPHSTGFSQFASGIVSVLFVPFLLVATLVQLYYFIACLFDERRDLSILFWRSLPVSDAMSVGVKLLVGALILPGFFLLAATITLVIFLIFAFILCSVLSLGYDISLWSLWGNSDIISNVLSTWSNILPYTLWLFPLYAWLMLVSMFSSKAPFLWAILPVVVLLLVEGFIVRYFHLDGHFFANILLDYFSVSRDTVNNYMNENTSFRSVPFSVISEKVSIAGTLVGAGFMYLTYWLRANRSHS